MTTIRDRVNTEMKGFGVAIEDVRIRRADLPDENTKAIPSRMQSERQRVASHGGSVDLLWAVSRGIA